MINLPLISVVTVTYNAVATIEQTILSVINQTYPHIEYIIIDGGSTDGTVDIIKKYADKIAYWVSEPDKGIYDAMNKGIKVATGEWINFMNCGDSLYTTSVLADIFNDKLCQKKGSDVIYGDACIMEKWGAYEERPRELCLMTKCMVFCHQSAFVKTCLMKENLFDIELSICADYKFFHLLWKEGKNFIYQPLTVANYNHCINSLSHDNGLRTQYENLLVSGMPFRKLKIMKFAIRYWLGIFFRFILPSEIIQKKRQRYIMRSPYTKKVYW